MKLTCTLIAGLVVALATACLVLVDVDRQEVRAVEAAGLKPDQPMSKTQPLTFVPPETVVEDEAEPEPSAVTPTDDQTTKPATAPLRETSERIETYDSGAIMRRFGTLIRESVTVSGTITGTSRSSRDGGPLYALYGEFNGIAPQVGDILVLHDKNNEVVCTASVVRRYHFDDDEDLPVEEVGLTIKSHELEQDVNEGDRLRCLHNFEVKHGAYNAWYEDGTLACTGEYDDGNRCGEWTYWYPNGQRRATGGFFHYCDVPTNHWTFWYECGGRWAERGQDRTWQVWLPDGSVDVRAHGSISVGKAIANLTDGDFDAAQTHLVKARSHVSGMICGDHRRESNLLLDELESVLAEAESSADATDVAQSDSTRRLLRDLNEVLRWHKRPDLPPAEFAPCPLDKLKEHHLPSPGRDPKSNSP